MTLVEVTKIRSDSKHLDHHRSARGPAFDIARGEVVHVRWEMKIDEWNVDGIDTSSLWYFERGSIRAREMNSCRESRLRRLWRRMTQRKRRCEPNAGWDFPPEGGVREPRRPLPFGGAGAAAVPFDQ